jgi:hypothetical protein
MPRNSPRSRRSSLSPTVLRDPLFSRSLRAAVLRKLAKHLALLACFMIAGQRTGQSAIGELGIFLLLLLAAVINLIASGPWHRSAVDTRSFRGSA